MKYLANFLRICVGLLFIFSGLIKSNDPTGFSYKLDEYFSVFSADLEPSQDSLIIYFNHQNQIDTFSHTINPNQQKINIVVDQSPWINNTSDESIFERKLSFSVNNQEIYRSNTTSFDTLRYISKLSYEISNKLIGQKNISTLAKFIDTIDITSHIIPNPIYVDFFQKLRSFTIPLAMGICVLEVLLGVALILGWAPRLILSSIFILTLFFTFLTWYSAYFNKVTDCGCFGDAIKLTPWESFYKDVILGSATLLIGLGIKHIKPVFSTPFSVKILTISLILSVGFSIYCWHYLPVKNFLKFKKGNDIFQLANVPDNAPSDVYENIFIYAKDGINEEFTIDDISQRNLKEEGYVFVDRIDKLISKGFEPEIHDFKIMDVDHTNDYIDDFYSDSGFKLLIVFNDIEKSDNESIDELKSITRFCNENQITIYPLTASKTQNVEEFSKKHNLNIPFYYGDKTNLKSIIRSNPGLVLLQKNVVIENWPSTRLPSEKQLSKLIIQ